MFGVMPWDWPKMKWADFWILKQYADAKLKKPQRF